MNAANVIKYEVCNALDTAVGCADVIPPRNVWWKRVDDGGTNATFGCTGQTLPVHRMSCVGNDWHSDTTPDTIDCADPPLIGTSSLYTSRTFCIVFAVTSFFSAICNIYISRLCYDVSVRLFVRLSVTEVHWRIIANLGFKSRSQFTSHCGRGACGPVMRDHRREEWRDHLALC